MYDCYICEKMTEKFEFDEHLEREILKQRCGSEDSEWTFGVLVSEIDDHECEPFVSVERKQYQPDMTTSKPVPQ